MAVGGGARVSAAPTPPRGDAGSVAVVGGGTWLFSEPQPHLTRLVDLSAMGWTPLAVIPAGDPQGRPPGLLVAATCTLAQLSAD